MRCIKSVNVAFSICYHHFCKILRLTARRSTGTTVHNHKLFFSLSTTQILMHLFHEETIRIFELQSIYYSFKENSVRIYAILCSLEREAIDSIIRKFDEFVVSNDSATANTDWAQW
ncbi:MAG: Hsp33 family molecular chaperone HslO [Proteobacteria bacterium]|nr:Hsp33 family molecular chaperone HslO [Pseudomonadota bacterium]